MSNVAVAIRPNHVVRRGNGWAEVTLPYRLFSMPNLHCNRREEFRIKKELREFGAALAMAIGMPAIWEIRKRPACRVQFTRIGVRFMDSDNCNASFKNVRDGIAAAFAVDDGNEKHGLHSGWWEWLPAMQERGAYAVRVRFDFGGGT